MSIKRTKIYYPHIVKEYASVEEFVTENNYTEFYDNQKSTLVSAGIDVSDDTKYKEILSEDSFEVIVTAVFPSQEVRDEYLVTLEEVKPSLRKPIFVELTDEHII